jgi:chemotaxis protein methyltransferase CheR
MDDNACIGFLQWALPGLHMRWAGFRKVRNQVCKRIGRRLQALQLQDVAAYQDYLQRHREEWMVLDGLCRVTISRFFRDRLVFSSLRSAILPGLVQRMRARGETALRIWSAGCAAGEEPYSLSILWELDIKCRAADAQATINIIATDSDRQLLDRAVAACYPYSSIKNLAEDWRLRAFVEHDGEYCLRPSFRQNVKYVCQDVRGETPPGVFDLVLCRNLVFTYFDDELQRRFLRRLDLALQPQGFLVTGIHETLPQDYDGFAAWSQRLGIYQRRS